LVCGTNNCRGLPPPFLGNDFHFQWTVRGLPDDNSNCCTLPSQELQQIFESSYSPDGCSSDNCECTQDEVAASIDRMGEICLTSTDSGCRVDPSILPSEIIFDVPSDICKDELDAADLFQEDETKDAAQADINAAFKCLYYSALVNSFNGLSCDSLFTNATQEECNRACNGRTKPIFEVKDGAEKVGNHFNYRIPTFLPPLEERLGRDSKGQLLGGVSLGEFVPFDVAITVTDETAANFAVDVFEEFMNCSVSQSFVLDILLMVMPLPYSTSIWSPLQNVFVTELAPNNTIFKGNKDGKNPYAPNSGSPDGQFSLPLDILNTATDEHGQILGQYLDQLFDYTSFGNSSGIEVCESGRSDCKEGSLVFSDDLRGLFIEAFVYNSIDEQIDLYQKCIDDKSTQLNKDRDGESDLGICEGSKFYTSL